MPDFNNLLGFKDFGEALFAQSQLEDDTRKFPGYGIAEKAKIANLESAIESLTQTTPSGLVVTIPTVVELTADYEGNITSGLPATVEVEATLLGLDVMGDTRLEVIFTPTGITGSEPVDGTYEITSVQKVSATLKVLINFAGVKQGEWDVAINTVKAEAPPVVPPPPVGTPVPAPVPGVATPAASIAMLGVDVTSYKLLGTLQVGGGFSYRAVLSSAFVSPQDSGIASNIEAYIAYRPLGGNWVIEGGMELGVPIEYDLIEDADNRSYFNKGGFRAPREQLPGSINISRDLVLPSGTYEIGFFAQLLYGSAVNLYSPATVRPL